MTFKLTFWSNIKYDIDMIEMDATDALIEKDEEKSDDDHISINNSIDAGKSSTKL